MLPSPRISAWGRITHKMLRKIDPLYKVMDVSARGLRTFHSRPVSRRQRSDLVTRAHIKEQSRLSLGSYGRPRMPQELKEIGIDVAHRRVGRSMRQNGISVMRARKHKLTTDSDHKFNIAPNLLDHNFNANAPNQKWAGPSQDIAAQYLVRQWTSAMFGRVGTARKRDRSKRWSLDFVSDALTHSQ